MKKIEFIWREILFQTIEKRTVHFEQQRLAKLFGISSSTVHAALAPLREIGAVKVGGRGFTVIDYEKILYHWANHRKIISDCAMQLSLSLPVREIEELLPAETITTAYTAFSERFREIPADYESVWCYHSNPTVISKRFAKQLTRRKANLFVINQDPFLSRYGNALTLAQLFVDLWQMHDWYAKEFLKSLKEQIDGLLS